MLTSHSALVSRVTRILGEVGLDSIQSMIVAYGVPPKLDALATAAACVHTRKGEK